MLDRICSHCGSTVLVGLQYCPGCLRAIEKTHFLGKPATPADNADSGVGADTVGSDLSLSLAHTFYPLKSNLAILLRRPVPPEPPPIPVGYKEDESRFGKRRQVEPSRMALSLGYTRVVCPKCQSVQRCAMDVSPSDIIKCRACHHRFPGSFASEFRKGADLECYRCGVTTFCVTGLHEPSCPNCRNREQRVRAKTRVKPGIVVAVVAAILFVVLSLTTVTHTTPQFLVWLSLTCIGSIIGFVTLAALGF